MQGSDHTFVPQLNLGPFGMMICQLGWEKIDLIRALKHLADMLHRTYPIEAHQDDCTIALSDLNQNIQLNVYFITCYTIE